jgi:hypothetical protein
MRYSYYYCTLCLLSILFYSCQKNEKVRIEKIDIGTIENHKVTLEQAKNIAKLNSLYSKAREGNDLPSQRSGIALARIAPKEIKDARSIAGNTADADYYIISYKDSGFAIVSGDDRLMPIVAYSETSPFPVIENGHYPTGLVGWLAKLSDTVKTIRTKNIGQDSVTKHAWEEIQFYSELSKENVRSTADLSDAKVSLYHVACTKLNATTSVTNVTGPFLSSTWGQWDGYNNTLTYANCSASSNGMPPSGCVATSTGQIMRYYTWPTSYDWANMPLTYGTNTTSNLLKDIGSAVGMSYACDGSSATTANAASALVNNFNYKSASYNSTYNYVTVESELYGGHPVILSGGSISKFLFFNVYSDGHAWVADGVTEVTYYKCIAYIPVDDISGLWWDQTANYLYFHMNWGWSGQYDGWYGFQGFNPGSYTFNYKPAMITNIRPN